MTRKTIFSIILIVPLMFIISGCVSSINQNQLSFGIQAAKKDLWDEAIFRWEKCLKSNPNSASAHNNLAVAYEKKGLLDKAKKEYEEALKISPENKHIKSNYENFKKARENTDDEKK